MWIKWVFEELPLLKRLTNLVPELGIGGAETAVHIPILFHTALKDAPTALKIAPTALEVAPSAFEVAPFALRANLTAVLWWCIIFRARTTHFRASKLRIRAVPIIRRGLVRCRKVHFF